MTSETKSLDGIRSEVEDLAAKISAEQWMLPTYGHSEETGRPHIEVDGSFYYYVQSERGGESSRWKSNSLDELLFVIFRGVVSAFNWKEPKRPKIEGKDQRRQWFQQNVELMSILSDNWANRLAEFQQRLIELHPFDDSSDVRSDFARTLQGQGRSREESWKIASERYPQPKHGTFQESVKLYEEFHLPHGQP